MGSEWVTKAKMARKSAWHSSTVQPIPGLSMLRRFAVAVGIPVAELLKEESKKKMLNVASSGLKGIKSNP